VRLDAVIGMAFRRFHVYVLRAPISANNVTEPSAGLDQADDRS
jgi:hypothetical protein